MDTQQIHCDTRKSIFPKLYEVKKMNGNFYCEGVDKAPQRSLFHALGMTKEEMERPLVGIVSSYNEIVPGHMNIDKIVEAVKLALPWLAVHR